MYNRYVPQGDGSFRKSQVQDRPIRPPVPECPPEPEPVCCPPPQQNGNCSQCPHRPPSPRPPKPKRAKPQDCPAQGVGSFLRNLLPGNFDTEDLLIVLLLLLMSGECQEDGNLPLLTLALYLFL